MGSLGQMTIFHSVEAGVAMIGLAWAAKREMNCNTKASPETTASQARLLYFLSLDVTTDCQKNRPQLLYQSSFSLSGNRESAPVLSGSK